MRKNLFVKSTELERSLKLRFKDRSLLEQALIHPSYLNEVRPGERSMGSYERLEFLGDAMLGLAVTHELFERFPQLAEGHLTKLRSALVKGDTLAKVADRLQLARYLELGKGEESTGGRERQSNLAATFEALVGAVFLDRGFDAARKFVLQTMAEEVEEVVARAVPEDAKSRLQEVVQREGGALPLYQLVGSGGPDHARSFDVEVIMDGQVRGRGRGRRKLEAEQRAAEEALHRLSSNPDG